MKNVNPTTGWTVAAIYIVLLFIWLAMPKENVAESASKYKGSTEEVAYSLYRFENSEAVCYYAGNKGGVDCKWKDK